MSQKTNRLMVLVSALVVVAFGFAAVGPVLAQVGTGSRQAGESVPLQEGDTLGDLLLDNNVQESDIGLFVSQNASVLVEEGQTVTFPFGVTVTGIETPAADETVVGETPAADETTVAETPAAAETAVTETPAAEDTAATATTAVAETPEAGDTTGSATGEPQGFVCDPTGVESGETYVTVQGDSLGSLFDMMGIDVAVFEDPAQAATDDLQTVVDFINLNCDLAFVGDQQLTLPPAVAVTGQEGTTTPEVEGTPAATELATEVAVATATVAATATVEATVEATEVGATPEATEVGATPEATEVGATPEATAEATEVGATPEATAEAVDLNVEEGATLSELIARFNLTTDEEIAAFVHANPDLVIVGGQTLNQPESVPATGAQPSQAQTGGEPAAVVVNGEGEVVAVSPLNLHIATDDVPKGLGVYIVQGGDSLSSIARAFDTTVEELMKINPNTITGDTLLSGQLIYVPGVEYPPGGWQYQSMNQEVPSQ